jgi:hypothetical protein
MDEARRWPLLPTQLCPIGEFANPKRASEWLGRAYRDGFIKRAPCYREADGTPPFFYFLDQRPPHPRLHTHTAMIGDLRASAVPWERADEGVRFFFGPELPPLQGLLPDAGVLRQKGDKAALIYLEADASTTKIIGSLTGGYSLDSKIRSYARAFDAGRYKDGFTARITGFRVGLVLTSIARLEAVHRLIARAGFDFVLLTTLDQVTATGLHAVRWTDADGHTVDIFGQEQPMEIPPEKVPSAFPHLHTINSPSINDLRAVVEAENLLSPRGADAPKGAHEPAARGGTN